ncbi:MAG: hypothetical protein AAGF11_36595 [Myxococcota bacterium]
MSALGRGLGRVLAAPELWLGTWLGLVLWASLLGWIVQSVVAAAVMPFGAMEPDHVIFGLLDVLGEHRGAAATVLAALSVSGALSAVIWLVLAPVVIARLSDEGSWSQVGARALPELPAVLVQTLWHGVLRALLVLAVLLSVQPLPAAVGWSLLGLGWLWCTVALDAARVAVVEHGAAPFHVRSAAQGFVYTIRRPALLLPCALMSLGQWLITATALWLSLAGIVDGTPWGPRGLAALSVGLGLWRVATMVARQKDDPPPTPDAAPQE